MKLEPLDWLNMAIVAGGVAATIFWLYAKLGTRTRIRRRLEAAIRGPQTQTQTQTAVPTRGGLRTRALRGLYELGNNVPVFNGTQRLEMRRKLLAAGYRQPFALPVLVGVAMATAFVLSVLTATLILPLLEQAGFLTRAAAIVLSLHLGLLLPRIILDQQVRQRQSAIADSFPDALDLLVICSSAGLGLNASIQRVAQELELLAPELTDEFALAAAQLQLSVDTAQVLHDMADRIDMDSVRSLASTLVQSRQYGTPINEALRVLASGERNARQLRTEEAAGKLATKMTIPMMLFILPTVLLIVGGPAVLGLMNAF